MTIAIANLELNLRLDLEAMRAIVGSGTHRSWQAQVSPFLLIGALTTGAGQRVAGTRWSAFLRRRDEPAKPYEAWRAAGTAVAHASASEDAAKR